MSGQEQETNRNEAPTPYKLKRAREKGMVARSMELGLLGGLIALTVFILAAGHGFAARMAQVMRTTLSSGIERAGEPEQARALIGQVYWTMLAPVMLLGATIMAVVIFLEIIQLRGLIFTAHPLKPDFSRLNPAKGLKRLFSARMLKETLKSVLKALVYGVATWLVIRFSIDRYALIAGDGERLAEIFAAASLRLMFVFILIAFGFVILDQMIVRGEFLKQMRMSRREVTRESKEREGDPRIKQKRKQLHAEFVKANSSVGALAGSDLLIVNPDHFAVALRYDAETMTAPRVTVKGRNRLALRLKDEAFRRGVPILVRPELARALHRKCAIGADIPPDRFEAVAQLYIQLYRDRQAQRSD